MSGMHNPTIMLVEDNRDLQRSIIDLLVHRGYSNIAAFTDAFSAIKYFHSQVPDLAILDVEMHGISGLDLLEELKHTIPYLPVILMSSHHDRHIILRACECGADTFFPKPFDSELFCRKVEELLKRVDF